MNKQISLTIPETLFEASRDYSEKRGYRSTQEFIVDLVRRRVLLGEEERLQRIAERVEKRPSVKAFKSKEDAFEYLDRLWNGP